MNAVGSLPLAHEIMALGKVGTGMMAFVTPMAMKELKGAWGEASDLMKAGATWDDVKAGFNKNLAREFREGDIGTQGKLLRTPEYEYVETGKTNALGEPIFKRKALDTKAEKGQYTPSDYMDSLVEDPWFFDMNPFDRVKVFSEVERAFTPSRSKTYSNVQSVAQNRKTKNSNIVSIDTIRGCGNNCPSCFACSGGSQGNIIHTAEVPQKWRGKLDPNNILRVGVVGDPASDWNHSNALVKSTIENSKGASSTISAYLS